MCESTFWAANHVRKWIGSLLQALLVIAWSLFSHRLLVTISHRLLVLIAVLCILQVPMCNITWSSFQFSRFLCAILSALIPVISTELQPDVSFPLIYALR